MKVQCDVCERAEGGCSSSVSLAPRPLLLRCRAMESLSAKGAAAHPVAVEGPAPATTPRISTASSRGPRRSPGTGASSSDLARRGMEFEGKPFADLPVVARCSSLLLVDVVPVEVVSGDLLPGNCMELWKYGFKRLAM